MGSNLHPTLHECAKSELDLFCQPPVQTSCQNGYWCEYLPISTITEGSPIDFHVSASSEEYLDLSQTHIHVQAQITQGDGTNLARDAAIGPTNYWLHSLFSQLDIQLNDKLVTDSSHTYAYKSFLETLLSFGTQAKESFLTGALWYKDKTGSMDDVANANTGLVKRRSFTSASKVVDMYGKVHADIFAQPKYLLDGVSLKLRFVRSPDNFCVMSAADGDFKVVIKSMSLFIRKVHISPAVRLAHIKALEKGNALYPITRTEVKVFSVATGSLSANIDNLFLGQLPKRIVLGCVATSGFNGTKNKNPFNFKHYGLNFLALYVDGQQIPAKAFKPNFETKQSLREYISLFTGTGQFFKDEGNDISREEFNDGFTLYALDLSPDLNEGTHTNPIKRGSMRLEMHFADALTETVNIVCFGEYFNTIEISKNRQVVFDYNA